MSRLTRFIYIALAILAIPSLGFIGFLSMQEELLSKNLLVVVLWAITMTLSLMYTVLTAGIAIFIFGSAREKG